MEFVLGVRTTSANIEYRPACPNCIRQSGTIASVTSVDTIERDVERLTLKAKKSNYARLKSLLRDVGRMTEQIASKAGNSDREAAGWYNTAVNIHNSRRLGDKRHLVEYCCQEEAIKDAECRYDPRALENWVKKLTVISEAIKAVLEDR